MLKSTLQFSAFLLIAGGIALLSACGGGSAGGGAVDESAYIYLDVSPSSIDSGDRLTVRVHVSEMNELGIMLKIKYPSGLRYVDDSSVLEVDGAVADFFPQDEQSAGDSSYLAYFLSPKDLGRDGSLVLRVALQGVALVSDGRIEADADLDDPEIENEDEFSASDPRFSAQDSWSVNVAGDPAATPTPTATPGS